ncbi:MAG: hypothetical protein MK102_14785 [Fuerstiella sp.]|nr:hypothetical protein [Fuerstiella sp.]
MVITRFVAYYRTLGSTRHFSSEQEATIYLDSSLEILPSFSTVSWSRPFYHSLVTAAPLNQLWAA